MVKNPLRKGHASQRKHRSITAISTQKGLSGLLTFNLNELRSFMKILKLKDVVHLTGLSPVTIWRLEQRGEFPIKIALSPNRVGWLEDEVKDWIGSRPRINNQQDAA